MSQPQVSFPSNPETPTSHLPYSPCAVVDRVVYVSGQASVDKTGKIISDTFEAEFRRSIENMRNVLAVAGCDLKDVIQTRNYVRDEEDLVLYNQLYAEYFSKPLPARATLTNCLPSTIRYEIECIAVIPE
ncbi:RidA family protein [Rubinisphaera italica]|uniref:Enamine/imine deaminase n=1 Tax=Rubinisphaera italica TaxID=2527969 RepID=A0A5C5XQ12_9PLAN|nr:RidA family protein [Rubinisphaera italica]TWT64503.1 Enamine/imine deaminase [Rubinisphaera italica]